MTGKIVSTYHFHSAENSNWISLLDFAAVVYTNLNYDARHGCADLAAVAQICLWPADVLHRRILVVDGDLSDLTIHLIEYLSLARILG